MLVAREGELAALEELLGRGGVVVVEGGPGVGKSALVHECVARARLRSRRVVRAQGWELEAGFAFGVVRQLFERELASLPKADRARVSAGPAARAAELLLAAGSAGGGHDGASFALLHGLYWLTVNLADDAPLLIAVDDAQWADSASLRWLGFLARRLDDVPVAVIVAMRPAASGDRLLAEIRTSARVLRPAVLDEEASAAVVRSIAGDEVSEARCGALWRASGGNPFYLVELLRGARHRMERGDGPGVSELLGRPSELVRLHVESRIRRLAPGAVALAASIAVLGDGCRLRHAAAVAGIGLQTADRLAAGLVSTEVLATSDPPRFLHPIVRAAVEASLAGDQRRRLHRAAAAQLAADHAAPGQVAAHLMRVSPAGEAWVLAWLRRAARAAMAAGAAEEAVDVLVRALAEPPAAPERVGVLCELATAEVCAGRSSAIGHLEQALALTEDPRERARIARAAARTFAALFRWVDAVDVTDRALRELGDRDPTLAAQLRAELAVAGMHDARRAHRVLPTLARLTAPPVQATIGTPAIESVVVARGMASVLTGRADADVVSGLEATLSEGAPAAPNWDTRAALLWTLVILERFDAVQAALPAMIEAARRAGSARGLIALYSSLGFLQYRLGALSEADAASRIALRVLRAGDFAAGLGVGAIIADTATEVGDFDTAAEILDQTPDAAPGVISVLVPAARGRLCLARGDGEAALRNYQQCRAMFGSDVWGIDIRDVGYLHARCGAAEAQLLLGNRDAARELADAELVDLRGVGGPRAVGIALRVAGLVRGGRAGMELLAKSVETLRASPATLERAKSLPQALDLAASCGARPLAERTRGELTAAGGRPRRERRRGVDALTPSELRVARLAADGLTNRQIAHTLYLTTKTVETHLAHAYPKLGISSRTELPAALGS